MEINLECIYCTIKKADSLFSKYETDSNKKLAFMKEVFKIVSECEIKDTSPSINAKIMRCLDKRFQLGDPYYEIKKQYNELLLSMEQEIFNRINQSNEKLLTALKYAMIGNFIDFGAMDEVDVNQLKRLIEEAPNKVIDTNEYKSFLVQLEKAEKVTYIVDNAGEIVFDKIFIQVIKERYPDKTLDVIVRGKPIHNDATIIDAQEVGLCNIVNVVDNGTDIPGTQLDKINKKAKQIIDNADLIIAKGQGNFETLFGCNKNIYYAFLCKCDLFTKRFNIEKFSGIFINETNVKDRIKQ